MSLTNAGPSLMAGQLIRLAEWVGGEWAQAGINMARISAPARRARSVELR